MVKKRIDPLFEEDQESFFEERADHVEEGVLKDGTATGDHVDEVVKALLSKSLVLLVGPRGCGKTHLMRYAWLTAVEDSAKPFCVYTSLNRYLSLEPWSRARTDANALFHSWVLARILQAALAAFERMTGSAFALQPQTGFHADQLDQLVNSLERNFALDDVDESIHRSLSVEGLKDLLRQIAAKAGRDRVVLFLDDAALTLTPTFMTELLDVLRVIKGPDIAPKCSIYPGTTVFGTRFHADHEGRTVSAWLSVNDPTYLTTMQTIAQRRYPEGLKSVSEDTNTLLQYAAFGIPRAYLTLLRLLEKDSSQAAITKVIRNHRDNRLSEFRSLADKVVELKTLVKVGEQFFEELVKAVKAGNDSLEDKGLKEKQALVGILSDEFDPMVDRMVDLLEEAGLIYPEDEVSHGPARQYRRFCPHFAALIAARAFAGGGKGTSSSAIVEVIQRPSQKHPVRRTFKTILGAETKNSLKLDLPPCQKCQTPRQSENQRFCQACGNRLADELIYNRIMAFELAKIPSLTQFQVDRVRASSFRTVGDLRAARDPGSELRKVNAIGLKRSKTILDRVELYVEEMMT